MYYKPLSVQVFWLATQEQDADYDWAERVPAGTGEELPRTQGKTSSHDFIQRIHASQTKTPQKVNQLRVME